MDDRNLTGIPEETLVSTAGKAGDPTGYTAKDNVQFELDELLEKIRKLTDFLFSTRLAEANLMPEMVNLLDEQLKVMQAYATILQHRLAIWDHIPNKFFHHEFSRY